VGQAFLNLGNCLQVTGDLEGAWAALTRARDVLAAFYGRHELVAYANDNLAVVLLRLDRPDQALVASDEALGIYREVGGSGPAFAACLSNRGAILSTLGEDLEARDQLREALGEWERSSHVDRASLRASLLNLAQAEFDLGNAAEAVRLQSQAEALAARLGRGTACRTRGDQGGQP
jgi:tetratricopeptide (TPR) repeat protein